MAASGTDAKPSSSPATKSASEMTPATGPVDAADELAAADATGPATPAPVKKIRLVSQTTPAKSLGAPDGGHDQFHLLMDPKSIVGDIDLRQLILNPAVWELLSAEERQAIVALWPHASEVDQTAALPRFDELRSNDSFRASVSEYQRQLKNGQHEPEWICQARAAHDKRARGVYDAMLAAEFREYWAVDKPGLDRDGESHEPSSQQG